MDSVTITDLFDDFLSGVEELDEETRSLVVKLKRDYSYDEIQRMRQRLSETANRADCAADPIVVLREAIMDETDIAILAQVELQLPAPERQKMYAELKKQHEDRRELYTDEAFLAGALGSLIMYRVLRLYAGRKYDDVGEDDWLWFYCTACEWKNMGMVHEVRRRLGLIEGDTDLLDDMYYALKIGWHGIRQFALKAKPKEKILRSDERTEDKIKELLNIKTDEGEC